LQQSDVDNAEALKAAPLALKLVKELALRVEKLENAVLGELPAAPTSASVIPEVSDLVKEETPAEEPATIETPAPVDAPAEPSVEGQ